MLNYLKVIEILISLQSIYISTMIPVFVSIKESNKLFQSLEIPITWQIPTIILLSLIFKRKVVYIAFSIYLFLGLFIIPIFHQGGSLGYLLTPNFGYLIGIYPLIKIIDKLNTNNKILISEFLKSGILALTAMHITGILYSFLLMLFYNKLSNFLYNLSSYSLGKIGFHFLMLIPLSLLIKPINYSRYKQ